MQDLVFVHGMFQNPESWNNWIPFFTDKGYRCHAPAWPCHEGMPDLLRANPPPELGKLGFDEVLAHMEALVAALEHPLMIGHSVGGLITQILLNRGLIRAGVAICPVAPNAMFELDWDFIRIGAKIANPLKGDEPIYMDEETFHNTFANTLSASEAAQAYRRFAVHDSRNVLRGCLGSTGRIDLEVKRGPLLLIAGDQDRIIPAELVKKNFEAYDQLSGLTSHQEFAGRSHFICNEAGWLEVAAYSAEWLENVSTHPAATPVAGLAGIAG